MIRRLRTGARARPVSLGVLVVTIAALGGCGGSGGSAKLPLQTVAELPLPGGSSRFDYQSVDPSANQLFIAHLGAGSVTIVDTEGRRVVTDVGNIAEAHGVYAVPELGVAFASATGTNELVAIDAKRGRVLRRTPTGSFPDGVTYEPSTKRVFVSDKDGGTLTAISATPGLARSSPMPREAASW